jgi:hypothetical protein
MVGNGANLLVRIKGEKALPTLQAFFVRKLNKPLVKIDKTYYHIVV